MVQIGPDQRLRGTNRFFEADQEPGIVGTSSFAMSMQLSVNMALNCKQMISQA